MAWSIDDEKSWNIHVNGHEFSALLDLLDQLGPREECRSDLLGDTACFIFLHVGVTDLVQQSGLAGIDMTQYATDRRSVLALSIGGKRKFVVLEYLQLRLVLLDFHLWRSLLLFLSFGWLGCWYRFSWSWFNGFLNFDFLRLFGNLIQKFPTFHWGVSEVRALLLLSLFLFSLLAFSFFLLPLRLSPDLFDGRFFLFDVLLLRRLFLFDLLFFHILWCFDYDGSRFGSVGRSLSCTSFIVLFLRFPSMFFLMTLI